MKLFRIAALMFLAAASPAMSQMVSLDIAHEVLPELIRMPASVTGELSFQACITCKMVRLRASAATRYFVGEQEVTLADMKKYMDHHPNAGAVVVQPKNELSLSSMRVSATTRAR